MKVEKEEEEEATLWRCRKMGSLREIYTRLEPPAPAQQQAPGPGPGPPPPQQRPQPEPEQEEEVEVEEEEEIRTVPFVVKLIRTVPPEPPTAVA